MDGLALHEDQKKEAKTNCNSGQAENGEHYCDMILVVTAGVIRCSIRLDETRSSRSCQCHAVSLVPPTYAAPPIR